MLSSCSVFSWVAVPGCFWMLSEVCPVLSWLTGWGLGARKRGATGQGCLFRVLYLNGTCCSLSRSSALSAAAFGPEELRSKVCVRINRGPPPPFHVRAGEEAETRGHGCGEWGGAPEGPLRSARSAAHARCSVVPVTVTGPSAVLPGFLWLCSGWERGPARREGQCPSGPRPHGEGLWWARLRLPPPSPVRTHAHAGVGVDLSGAGPHRFLQTLSLACGSHTSSRVAFNKRCFRSS